MSGIEYILIIVYITGVIFNIAYLHYFCGKDRYENKELDEDSGLFETIFFGFFCLGFAVIEILGNIMLCFGSWITSVFYACWLIHFLYFTDEGKYRREYNKYLKQIVSTLTDWNRHLSFEKIEIRNGHINIYYKKEYDCMTDKNKAYIIRHIQKAIDNYPTLIPKVKIYNQYCNTETNNGYGQKTKIYLQYSKHQYEDKNINYN